MPLLQQKKYFLSEFFIQNFSKKYFFLGFFTENPVNDAKISVKKIFFHNFFTKISVFA
jgi:hypothetical protein